MDIMPLSDVSDMHVSSHCEKPFSSDFCQEFIGAFVRCAAGVVAGIKPGALYSFEVVPYCESCLSRTCPAVQYRAMMCDFAREVELFGVKIVPISPLHKRIHFLVYRTEHVKSIISEKQSWEFLRERGFTSSSWQDIMRDFRVVCRRNILMKLDLSLDILLRMLKVLYRVRARPAVVRGGRMEMRRRRRQVLRGLLSLNEPSAQDFLRESRFLSCFNLQAIPKYPLHKMEIPKHM